MRNSDMDNQHMAITLGKNLVVEWETPNINIQLYNNSHIMEYFLKSLIQGEELAELNIC